ncbi:2'-5' RNA ligase family protein [Novosphingobium terrae]|uniref:2'-5' RNA ligase family protein n=1 Tax=Novosphingobium terrae TaxID=2726189 RepID=UPI00198142F3|nr:2'-5' RNA ligase family protein [Novosphingobium terrae]
MLRYALPALIATMGAALPAHAGDTVSIDIYAIPSRPVVDAVAQASKNLAKRGMQTFYAQGHAVHATLYLTQYPASATPALKAAIARLVKSSKRFPLRVNGTERTASNWLFLKVQRSAELQRLADQVTLAAEPFRDHGVSAPGWMKDYPAKLPAFERYGSPNVFAQFEPHLTLLANESNPGLSAFVAEAEQNQPAASGQVEGIGIGIVDANGQIVKTLAEYHFR